MARSLGQAQKEFQHGVKEGGYKGDSESKADPALAVGPDEKVTMTRAELDALLAQKDAAAKATPEAPTASSRGPPPPAGLPPIAVLSKTKEVVSVPTSSSVTCLTTSSPPSTPTPSVSACPATNTCGANSPPNPALVPR